MKKENFIKLQLFAEGNGQGGAGGDGAKDNGDAGKDVEVDLKAQNAEYAAQIAKLKESLSKTNSENAEYKRKERERMTEEEKKKAEEEARAKEVEELRMAVNRTGVEKVFAGAGFKEEEYSELVDIFVKNEPLNKEGMENLAKKFVSLVQNREKLAKELSGTDKLKKSTVAPKPSDGGQLSDFAEFQKNNFVKHEKIDI